MTRAKTVESINLAIETEAIEPGPPDASTSPLFVGIDVAKNAHVAGFVSQALIAERGRFEKCPVLVFENSRKGFEQLRAQIAARCPDLASCTVLMESTGHYHKALEQFLLERGITLYMMHVLARPQSHAKTDKRDALSLANHIYNQVIKGIQFDDKARVARQVKLPSELARRLRVLVHRRYELCHDMNRRQNKLTAIADEIFPELTTVYKNPNLPSALRLREAFPTPSAIAVASLEALSTTRTRNRPSNAQLTQLKAVAAESIGTKDTVYVDAMLIEQAQLIAELRLLDGHLDALEAMITEIITNSREGQILLSIAGVGPMLAAAVIATMGDVRRFESAAKLKKYFGWALAEEQTGSTKDRSFLMQGGSKLVKNLIFWAVLGAIRVDSPWKFYYDRMVLRKCSYDERTKKWRGKLKVLGHVCGRMVEMIWFLLNQDAQLLANLPPGEEPPAPRLYDAEKHLAAMQRPNRRRRAS